MIHTVIPDTLVIFTRYDFKPTYCFRTSKTDRLSSKYCPNYIICITKIWSKTGATAARSVRVNRVCEMWVELTEQPKSLMTFEIFLF